MHQGGHGIVLYVHQYRPQTRIPPAAGRNAGLAGAGSTLSYGKTFSPHDRTVKLDGEAFSSWLPSRDHPFFVKTNTVVVKVVGTSFNVKMYKDTDDTEVVL